MLSSNGGSSIKSFHESFYGTPVAEEGRRRRGKRRHPISKDEPQNEVALVGVHYRSFDDDAMALFVNSTTALVPWNGDTKLLIDRYDVRHLLQDLTGIRRRRARPPSPDASKEELDYERYRDVEGLENPSPLEAVELKNGKAGGYKTVGFDYTVGDQFALKERVEDTLFNPSFFVPEHLRANLPTSTRLHQIMAGTAKYVFERGGQAEIVLRVKQANNPTFGFLMHDHHHHEYFRFLVDHPEHAGVCPSTQQTAAEVTVEASSEETEGGLSLLGTAYGDVDEDEDEDVHGEVHVDAFAGQQIFPTGEVLKLPLQDCDGNNGNGSTSKGSTTTDGITTGEEEKATHDTGDSCEQSLGSGIFTSTTGHGGSGRVPIAAKLGPLSCLKEAAPQGTKVFGLEDANEHRTDNLAEDHQVLPYKEPQIQLRRIIDKMVEFISRNGKEFEAIVKERDKVDHRFPFFLPWNEYYPYYSQALEASRQAQASSEASDHSVPEMSEAQVGHLEVKFLKKDEFQDSFLDGVPYRDESLPVELNDANGEATVSGMQNSIPESSQNGEGGMDFEAVLAAVRAATRSHSRAVEESDVADQLRVPDGCERPERGSDEAVLAAIRSATGRSKSDASGCVCKGDVMQMTGSSNQSVDFVGNSTAPAGTDNDGGSKSMGFVPSANGQVSEVLDTDHVVVVKRAASLVCEKGDLVDAQHVPSDKRKAERLKRVKLFTAMIKDKNGSLANSGLDFGSLSVSRVPDLERLSQASIALETTQGKVGDNEAQPSAILDTGTRIPTAEAMAVAGETETVTSLDKSGKEKKRKIKSKDHEKHRKHHHKKKRSDVSLGNEELDTRDKKTDRNHDHYQDNKMKDRKGSKSKDRKHRHEHDEKKKNRKSEDENEKEIKERIRRQKLECEKERRHERRHHTHDSEARRNDISHGHFAQQRKVGSRHGLDYEEIKEVSNHNYDWEELERRNKSEKVRKSKVSKSGHGSGEHRGTERLESGHGSGEHRGTERHGRELEETKKRTHSHGKKKKHSYSEDESESREERNSENYHHRSKKNRSHSKDLYQVAEHRYNPKQSNHYDDLKDGKDLGSVEVSKQGPVECTALKVIIADVEKPARTPIDVPEDIRAKVRAILSMT